jgi:hypothetical protein
MRGADGSVGLDHAVDEHGRLDELVFEIFRVGWRARLDQARRHERRGRDVVRVFVLRVFVRVVRVGAGGRRLPRRQLVAGRGSRFLGTCVRGAGRREGCGEHEPRTAAVGGAASTRALASEHGTLLIAGVLQEQPTRVCDPDAMRAERRVVGAGAWRISATAFEVMPPATRRASRSPTTARTWPWATARVVSACSTAPAARCASAAKPMRAVCRRVDLAGGLGVSGGNDGKARLFDVASGLERAVIDGEPRAWGPRKNN